MFFLSCSFIYELKIYLNSNHYGILIELKKKKSLIFKSNEFIFMKTNYISMKQYQNIIVRYFLSCNKKLYFIIYCIIFHVPFFLFFFFVSKWNIVFIYFPQVIYKIVSFHLKNHLLTIFFDIYNAFYTSWKQNNHTFSLAIPIKLTNNY